MSVIMRGCVVLLWWVSWSCTIGCGRRGFDLVVDDTAVPAIAVGRDFACAIRAGGVWCWGVNQRGQLGTAGGDDTPASRPVEVAGLADAIDLVAGDSSACALLSSGTVQCWGANDLGQLGLAHLDDQRTPATITGLPLAARALAAGSTSHCAVLTDDTAWCWGNVGGVAATPPSRVLEHVAQIAAGDAHVCARQLDGTVWCWGDNQFGQLGDGTTTSHATPMRVPDLTADAIALAGNHSCALSGGRYRCWGDNDHGQLGNGDTRALQSPAPPSDLQGISMLATAVDHTCAIADDHVQCWGEGLVGQLGNSQRSDELGPAPALLSGPAIAVATGMALSCAIRASGAISCWGKGSSGQLGNGMAAPRTPLRVALPMPASAVATGAHHSCAILGPTKSVYCWGSNRSGELGNGGGPPSADPVDTGVRGAKALGLGESHSCAARDDGLIACWGDGSHGEIGNGAFGPRVAPFEIATVMDVRSVASGDGFTCAANGTLAYCWGTNEHGELGDGGGTPPQATPMAIPASDKAPTAISVGRGHACAATGSGAWCWGDGRRGQLGDGILHEPPFASLVPVIDAGQQWGPAWLAAGGHHSCIRDNTGALRCWGDNTSGQLGDGTTVTRSTPTLITLAGATFAEVFAGEASTCAATSLGPHCWGDNYFGQLGDNTTRARHSPTRVSSLAPSAIPATGGGHSCAVVSSGEVFCWGDNALGQLGLGGGTFTVALTPVDVDVP